MAAGQEILTYCSKCKLDLKHIIVAHKSGNSGPVAKVRCNTCNAIHACRAKPDEKKLAAAAARKASGATRTRAQVVPVEVEWREQMDKADKRPSIAYAPQRDFKVGDIIDHSSFGAGIVRLIKEGNKCEVMFQHDVKVLVHRLKAAQG